MKMLSWGFAVRRAALLAVAVIGFSAVLTSVAGAEWEYYVATVEGKYELGGEITFTLNGSLSDAKRIFVFVESTKCEGTPAREDAKPTGRRLTPPEGEPLGPGGYAKKYTWKVAALHELSGVCSYIGAYSPSLSSELGWDAAMCEQRHSSNVERVGETPCPIPSVSQSELFPPLKPPPGEVLTPQALKEREEAKAREQAKAREALEHAKPTARCVVPGLRGHTLHGSRAMLFNAHCKLGKVRVRHGGRGPLRVVAQTPKRNTKLTSGGRVSITLGR